MANLQIVNKVMTLFANEKITSIKEDDWSERISAAIELQKKTILEKYDWSFALTYRKLNKVVIPEFSSYLYAYQIPVDIARLTSVHTINNEKVGIKLLRNLWSTNRDKLVTSYNAVILKYVQLNVDIDTQSGEFTDMYSYHIAAYLAPSLTESTKLIEYFEAKLAQTMQTAIMLDQLNSNSYQDNKRYENY